jgi:hypothetical protein
MGNALRESQLREDVAYRATRPIFSGKTVSSDRPNPYEGTPGHWWFDDRNSIPHGPYPGQNIALLALLHHVSEEREWRERNDTRRARQKSRQAENGR